MVLLVLLGLICLILFIVLAIPVRYRLSGSYGGVVRVKACVTWLLRAITVTITYEEDMNVSVRILGRKPFKKKESVPPDEEKEDEHNISHEDSDGYGELEDEPEWDDFPDEYTEEGIREEPCEAQTLKTGKSTSSRGEKRSGSIFGKLRGTLDSVKAKWNHLTEQKEKVEAFIKDESNQKTFRLLLRQLKKLVRHILPTKAEGKAVIGFEDPATTGKILAGLGLLYAWYGDKIEITPVFGETVLEVEGDVKGRVRAGTILLCCVRMLLNKNFRRILRKLKKSGGKKDGRK